MVIAAPAVAAIAAAPTFRIGLVTVLPP